MAEVKNIVDGKKFGIKEVADVAFYTVGTVKVSNTGEITATEAPKMKFETLKVSNLEFTGETTDARGGKGNAVLISWDHSREATLTLEDALMSMDTLAAMLSKDAASNGIITINANGFPGTYTVVGKTYARDVDGTDNLFTFVVYKAKVQSEATLTMEADGDPSVLSMTLKVLRSEANDATGAAEGDMIKLIAVANNDSDSTPDITFPEP